MSNRKHSELSEEAKERQRQRMRRLYIRYKASGKSREDGRRRYHCDKLSGKTQERNRQKYLRDKASGKAQERNRQKYLRDKASGKALENSRLKYLRNKKGCLIQIRKWKTNHPEAVKAIRLRYNIKNAEKIAAHRAKTREKSKITGLIYRLAHPERHRIYRLTHPEAVRRHSAKNTAKHAEERMALTDNHFRRLLRRKVGHDRIPQEMIDAVREFTRIKNTLKESICQRLNTN